MTDQPQVERWDRERHSLDQLRDLFLRLYEHMERSGARQYLGQNAFDKWFAGYEKQAGRARIILVAGDSQLTGFAEGTVKFPLPFYASEPSGYVHHLYVDESQRRRGTALALWRGLVDWFDANELEIYELHVVPGNNEGLALWRRLGFKEDSLQMRLKKEDVSK